MNPLFKSNDCLKAIFIYVFMYKYFILKNTGQRMKYLIIILVWTSNTLNSSIYLYFLWVNIQLVETLNKHHINKIDFFSSFFWCSSIYLKGYSSFASFLMCWHFLVFFCSSSYPFNLILPHSLFHKNQYIYYKLIFGYPIATLN